MKQTKTILTIGFMLLTSSIYSQKFEGQKFENYPAKILSVQKAKLNLSSNKLGKTFRTAITEGYKNGKINFGGHYIVIFWGAGAGMSDGAMVDTRTGIIYNLPLTEENSYRGATGYEENENIKYEANSYLFTCYSSEYKKSETAKIELNYFFYKFDEKTKKFKLISNKKKTVENKDK